MDEAVIYDVSIVGGGLAGLALSIQLKKRGYNVILFEKEQYPFHKVCGEYISLESWDFLRSLGLALPGMNLPIIKKLIVSSPDGNYLQHDLPLGGFGISRYTLDNLLKNIALEEGVVLHQNCKVEDVDFGGEQFTLKTKAGVFFSRVCCGSFGKRSNLDIKLKRKFIIQRDRKLDNYIGIKYHIKTVFSADTIALHNFKDGYCGISKIEEDRFCLCYLTNAKNLKENNNSIKEMEQSVLYKNKYLADIFEKSEILYTSPITISKISFSGKTQVENHILMLGDAAGMITPLCGNGMSMALHSSKIAVPFIASFLQKNITRANMENSYNEAWQKMFASRLSVGRSVQKMFGKEWLTNRFIGVMKHFPALINVLIKQTHGEPF
ncbi:MAG: NAD(P)/FAD-dependent oxidoreductase [Ferruginibacter sp.]